MSAATPHASFGGLVRSEWIKLFTLRTTWWLYGATVLLFVGIAVLIALNAGPWTSSWLNPDNPDIWDPSMSPADIAQSKAAMTATVGPQVSQEWIQWAAPVLIFAQLVVSVLGVLGIAGEYSTGAIKSTFAAAPKRIGALFAKVLVFFLTSVAVGVIGIAIGAAVSFAFLSAYGWPLDLGDQYVWRALGGAVAYLGFAGAFGMLIGAIIRVQAGAIPAAIGILLVLPTIVSLLSSLLDLSWLYNVGQFLPYSLSNGLASYDYASAAYDADPTDTTNGLNPPTMWIAPVHDGYDQAGNPDPSLDSGKISLGPAMDAVALAAWLVVGWIVAATVTRRRDV